MPLIVGLHKMYCMQINSIVNEDDGAVVFANNDAIGSCGVNIIGADLFFFGISVAVLVIVVGLSAVLRDSGSFSSTNRQPSVNSCVTFVVVRRVNTRCFVPPTATREHSCFPNRLRRQVTGIAMTSWYRTSSTVVGWLC